MPLTLEDKRQVVAELIPVIENAQSAIVLEYRGMSAPDMTQLRAQARQSGVYLRIVKNTLARRAVAQTPFFFFSEVFTGPLALAFSPEEPGIAARVINEFTKTNKKLVVKNVALRGRLLEATDLERLAKMPTREQALSQLMSVMQAPITKFVRTLAEPQAKLVRTLAAIRDSKQASET